MSGKQKFKKILRIFSPLYRKEDDSYSEIMHLREDVSLVTEETNFLRDQ